MNFAQFPPNLDQQEITAQNLDDTIVIVANISAFTALLLVTISCLCCVKRRSLQGRSEYGSYDPHLDHVPLEDLLSKPPLADPESVFSEASYDGCLSVHTSSRMTLISDGSGGSHDYLTPHQQDHNEASHQNASQHNASLRVHASGDAAHFSSARKWSSEKLKGKRATRPTRGQEKEFQRQSVQPDLIPLPTIPDDRSETSSLQSPSENPSSQSVGSNLTPETTKKQKSSKRHFESPTLERSSGLRIHRDSIKPECYTVSNSTRCSFSHELGHVAHGNKIPRTSLPRTEEGEDVNVKSDSKNSSAPSITCHITTSPAPVACVGNITVNSGSCLDKSGSDGAFLSKSHSDDVISNNQLEHECETGTTNSSEETKVNVASTIPANGALPSRIFPTSISIDGSLPTICDKARELSSCGGENESAALRRSFSFVNNNELPNGGRGTSKTFSLNLKINFHFGNEDDNSDDSRNGCATIEERSLHSLKADDIAQDLDSRVSNPDACVTTRTNKCKTEMGVKTKKDDDNKSEDKEKCRNKLFDDKAKNMNCKLKDGRERLSEPTVLERENSMRLSDGQPARRRFSLAESSFTGERSSGNNYKLNPLVVHKSTASKVTNNSVHGECGVSNEPRKDENMNTIESLEQNTQRASSDDSLDLNTKSTITESDSISSDADSTSSKKSGAKLQRTNAIIIDNKSPQLRRPIVTKKKTSIESCEANLRNAPSTPTPASPAVQTEDKDTMRSSNIDTTIRSETSPTKRETETVQPELSGNVGEVKGGCIQQSNENITLHQQKLVSVPSAENKNLQSSGLAVEKAKLSRTTNIGSTHRQQEDSPKNRRKAMFFTPLDAWEQSSNASDNIDSQTHVNNADKKSFKPVAMPRRKNPPQAKGDEQVIKTELHKSISDSATSDRPAETRDLTRSSTLPSRGNSLIPVLIVDDETDDAASSSDDDHEGLLDEVSLELIRDKKLDASDDSDYDNPWDNLDDAVKRASIRYNRRPSRLAAGSKTLLLKSAEDLGRLLEEAEKKRRQRLEGSHSDVISPEEEENEAPIIPFTRFSPYRHTVKGIVSDSNMPASHSTEDILKNSRQDYTRLSLLRKDAAKEHFKKGEEPRRPQSMTSKLKTKISSPETKHRKS